MKSISIFITAILLLCGLTRTSAQNNQSEEIIVMHPIPKTEQNPFGMQMPLPDTWAFHNNVPAGNPIITGTYGTKIYKFPAPKDFLFANDSATLKYYQDAIGLPARKPQGIDTIIENDLKPLVEENGYRFLKQYPLRNIAVNISEFAVSLFNALQLNSIIQVTGTEWIDKDGNMLLIVLQYTETGSTSDILSWGYEAYSLQASSMEFENARDHFIYGLSNVQYNPDDIKAYNQVQKEQWYKQQGYEESFGTTENQIQDSITE